MDVILVQVHLVVQETEQLRLVAVVEQGEMEEEALEQGKVAPQLQGKQHSLTGMEEEVGKLELRRNIQIMEVELGNLEPRDQTTEETRTQGMEEEEETMVEDDHQRNKTPEVEDVLTVFLKLVLMLVLVPMPAYLENVLLVAQRDVQNKSY